MTAPVLDPGFSTDAMSACWSPAARVRALLDVDAAVVRAAALGNRLPSGVASEIDDAIGRVATAADDVAADVLRDGWHAGTPVLPLRALVARSLSPDAATAFLGGHGTTSQDVIDTAVQLQIRRGLDLLAMDGDAIARRLRELASEHRSTAMIGRTFLQHARPTTFGLRAARWLTSVSDVLSEMRAARASCRIQFGGPVGAGPAGEITDRVASALDLSRPAWSWHEDRSPVAIAVAAVARLARASAKIATDVALLASSDVGELRVRSGGSASMAGKRNPSDSVRAIAAAEACAAAAAMVTGARPPELERGIGSWHVEWLAVPLAFMTSAAAAEAVRGCVDSIEVDAGAMERHLDVTAPATRDAVAAAAAVVDTILAELATAPNEPDAR